MTSRRSFCPSPEVLSAFADREASAREAAEIRAHLPVCPACSGRVEALAAGKRAVSAYAVPGMPADLREALIDSAPDDRGLLGPFLEEFRAGLFHSASLVSLGAAVCAALLFWARVGPFGHGPEIPADLLIGAHNQYALTMPLAPAERIMTEIPDQLAVGWGPEEDDGVY